MLFKVTYYDHNTRNTVSGRIICFVYLVYIHNYALKVLKKIIFVNDSDLFVIRQNDSYKGRIVAIASVNMYIFLKSNKVVGLI